MFKVPFTVLTDSYKFGHFAQMREAIRATAYAEFRKPFSEEDHRIVLFGTRYLVENILEHQYTVEEVEQAVRFLSTHNAGGTEYPFPKDLFLKFIKENNGYFPIRVQALPEGSIIYPRVPVFQLTAENEYAPLITFLETSLSKIYYQSTVATKSRHIKQLIEDYFEKTADEENYWKISSRLHDFGARGASSEETALKGGVAHLLNFEGSDTAVAAYYAQFHLNGGRPVANSIPATEHGVILSFDTEQEALNNFISKFGQVGLGIIACVSDTRDYDNFLNVIIPKALAKFKGKYGLFVARPDSGDPCAMVVKALYALERAVGSTVNSKGYKVLNGASVIQGDGIDISDIDKILEVAGENGFSSENCAFGMGANLLQKINRDTMSFAVKLSSITLPGGSVKDVMKTPKTDKGKFSLPGELVILDSVDGLKVYPKTIFHDEEHSSKYGIVDQLQTIYDKGPVGNKWPLFDDLRVTLNQNWKASPKKHDAISQTLKGKIARVSANA
jgi:nicotinic acid phosphoribosyltransferase